MDKVFLIIILIFYCPAALWLFLYGLNNYYMIFLFLRRVKKESSSNQEFLKQFWSTHSKDKLPKVTTQLPVYNERHVVERLIKAVVNIDYPKELHEIQLLDDSTDETRVIVADLVSKYRSIGFNIKQIARSNRSGFKAGALNKGLEKEVKVRTKDLAISHRNIKDSIKYASFIQNAILPQNNLLKKYFQDSFSYWQPKSIVGGDIYFVSELASKHEVLIIVIDGAGHGVPGAFVTMLVKAIEAQIMIDIGSGKLQASPAKILSYFNQSLKSLLNQEKGSKSNVGFDGGILYYNKATCTCKYAGAITPLYVIDDGQLNIIKSDRKSVGYIRTSFNQQYTEYDIDIKENTQLYITTDGLVDQECQNGYSYGKSNFKKFILEHSARTFADQKQLLIESLNSCRI